jgi:CBS domain-containing protein
MEGGRLAGMITDSDILRLLKTPGISGDLWLPSPLEIIEVPIREAINWAHTQKALSHIGDRPVRSVMSSPAISIGEDEEMDAAAALMVERRIGRLPVLRGKILVGIVARADIVRGLGESYGSKGGEGEEP